MIAINASVLYLLAWFVGWRETLFLRTSARVEAYQIPMRILIIDKTAVLETSHERYEKLVVFPDVELAVLSPVRWAEHMREVKAQRTSHPDYRIYLGRTFWTGSYSRGFYATGLKKALREFQPDIVQLLEEPWSLFTGQAVRVANRIAPEARVLFYTWENIYRKGTYCSKLDSLHRRIEATVFANCPSGVCATHQAAQVLRKRGFRGKTPVIPYGINDSFLLSPGQLEERITKPVGNPPRIGYVGRLLEMKGVDILIRALRDTEGRLVLLGSGEAEQDLRALASDIGIQHRIEWIRAVPPGGSVLPHVESRRTRVAVPHDLNVGRAIGKGVVGSDGMWGSRDRVVQWLHPGGHWRGRIDLPRRRSGSPCRSDLKGAGRSFAAVRKESVADGRRSVIGTPGIGSYQTWLNIFAASERTKEENGNRKKSLTNPSR